jgi:hypothetical protein
MQFLNAQLKSLDCKEFQKHHAKESDCSILINQDTTVLLNGKPLVVYIANLPKATDELFDALTKIKYETNTRTNGLVTSSKIFGYAPRNAIRQQACRAAAIAYQHPRESEVLKEFAKVAADQYRATNEQLAGRHMALTDEKVKPSYRMAGSMFTSGIVNHNNPLKYHFDSGNYVGVWSAMFAFKRGIEGGHLSCPEIDMAFECGNGSLTMFDGQSILHGVTPIIKKRPDSVRYTVVYYSLKQIWACESNEDEIDRMRNSRMKTENLRKIKQ